MFATVQPWLTITGLFLDIVGVVWAFTNWDEFLKLRLRRRRDLDTFDKMQRVMEAQRKDIQHGGPFRPMPTVLAEQARLLQELADNMTERLGVPKRQVVNEEGDILPTGLAALEIEALRRHAEIASAGFPWVVPMPALTLIVVGFALQIIGAWPS